MDSSQLEHKLTVLQGKKSKLQIQLMKVDVEIAGVAAHLRAAVRATAREDLGVAAPDEDAVDLVQYQNMSEAYDDAVKSLDAEREKHASELFIKDQRILTLELDLQQYEDTQEALKAEIVVLKRKRQSSDSEGEGDSDSESRS